MQIHDKIIKMKNPHGRVLKNGLFEVVGPPIFGEPPLIANQNGNRFLYCDSSGKAATSTISPHAREADYAGLRYDASPEDRTGHLFISSLFFGVPEELTEDWMIGCYKAMRERGLWAHNLAIEQRIADNRARDISSLPPPRSPACIQ